MYNSGFGFCFSLIKDYFGALWKDDKVELVLSVQLTE